MRESHDDQYFLFYNSCRVTEWPFWFGLILPFIVMYVFNWIAFTIIMITLLRRRKVENKKNASFFKQNLFIALGLSLLFGLGWGFGLFATSSDVRELTFTFQILFSVFVGSQGVLIFVFYGLRFPQFRQVWLSGFGLRKKTKTFMLSSKKDVGTSSKYKITDTGTLPIDQKLGTFQMQSTDPKGFSSVSADFEPGVSTFQMATVVENPESDI